MLRITLLLIFCFALPLAAEARQYTVRNGSQIAHTRMAPVVMHRALPPFKGQHVYAGRGEK